MTDAIHELVARYGVIAVFLGSVAEGESAAILGGFFAHQHVLVTWQTFAAAFSGAFVGDTLFFLAGRRFADHRYVLQLRDRPGFSHAYLMVRTHPVPYVLLNRYIYGFRLVGGIAAGLSGIPVAKFLTLNAASAMVWASIFCSLGYVFGLGAERFFGDELARHHRLFIAIGLGLSVAAAAGYFAHARSTTRIRK